jgi:hypothetical protein
MTMNNVRQNAAAAWRFARSDRFLMLLAAVLGVLLLAQGARYFLVGRYERSVLRSLAQNNGDPPERGTVKPAQEYAQVIMEHDMLGQTVKLPVKLWGIMGNGALCGTSPDDAQLANVGETLPGGDKVVEIRANEVVLEKEGKQRTEVLFDELKPPPQPGPTPPPPVKPDAPPPASPDDGAPKAEVKPPAPTAGGAEPQTTR